MAETFYTVLGVAADADAEAIRRAYREQVKEHHPDVSDDPAAPDEFQRLTTAKEVLVDDSERRRYDRLGHAAYVRDHVDSSVWTADATTTTTGQASGQRDSHRSGTTATGQTSSRSRQTGAGTNRTDWVGEGSGRSSRQRRRRSRDRRRAGATATASAEDWQYASDTYRRADTEVATGQQSSVRSVLSGLVSVGPWLVVHLIFIGSAVATAYLAIVTADAHVAVSWPTLIGGVLLLGAVVFASVLHVVSRLYS